MATRDENKRTTEYSALSGMDAADAAAPDALSAIQPTTDDDADGPAKAGAPAAAGRDPNVTGPTGFIGFDRQYGSNAAAAEKGASELAARVSAEGAQARSALQDAYGTGPQAAPAAPVLDMSREDGGRGEGYVAPAIEPPVDPSGGSAALSNQVSEASADARALGGSNGDIQALTGGTAFGARLTRRAGGDMFRDAAAQYGGLRGELAATDAGFQAERRKEGIRRGLALAMPKAAAATPPPTSTLNMDENRDYRDLHADSETDQRYW